MNTLLNRQSITNPRVVISGIENYSQVKPKGMWDNLNGVNINVDEKNMMDLWCNICNYKNTVAALETSKSSRNVTTKW